MYTYMYMPILHVDVYRPARFFLPRAFSPSPGGNAS